MLSILIISDIFLFFNSNVFFLTNSIQPKSYRSISSDLTNTKNLNLCQGKNYIEKTKLQFINKKTKFLITSWFLLLLIVLLKIG